MTLTSSIEKRRKFLLQMHSHERMRMWKHCFVLFLLSNQIGYTKQGMNGKRTKKCGQSWKKDEEVWPVQTILPKLYKEGKIILEPQALSETRT